MSDAAIAEFVKMWVVVNVGALIVLGVMAYVSSVVILDGLEALDRRLSGRKKSVSNGELLDAGDDAIYKERPNKSPEPTPTAVTPRAKE